MIRHSHSPLDALAGFRVQLLQDIKAMRIQVLQPSHFVLPLGVNLKDVNGSIFLSCSFTSNTLMAV